GLEEARIRPVEQARPVPLADPVADLGAEDRGHEGATGDGQDVQPEFVGRGEESGREEEGVAGEDDPEQKTGFGEDDQDQPDRANGLDEPFDVEEVHWGAQANGALAPLGASGPGNPRNTGDPGIRPVGRTTFAPNRPPVRDLPPCPNPS